MSASPPSTGVSGVPPREESPYFVTGGTMEPKAASYVEREADRELYQAMQRGEFCYVLTSRQMGKSSLFGRAAYRLRQEGVRISFFDLSGIGTNVTVSQWYDGMLERIGADFDLEDELDEFRERNEILGPQQMWLEVLRRILLEHIPGRITIIVDEIDLVRSLPFQTDEFFIGIRALYNGRSQDEELKRLSFCLLGVASPAELIANKEITPFNIGRRIELRDFTEQECLVLAEGMAGSSRPQAEATVRRVYHWTRGQPYLTQRICEAVAALPGPGDAAAVDRIAGELFLTQRAQETEPNLTFIRDRILSERRTGKDSHAFEELLRLYRRVWRGRHIVDSEVTAGVARLKLSGLVRGENGRLVVKNPIYRANFNDRWIRGQLPRNWARIASRMATVAVVVFLLACLPLAIIAWRHMRIAESQEGLAREESRNAKMETEAAGRARAEAEAARLDASNQAEKARQSDADRAKAFGQLYRTTIENLWTNGRRFVAGSFLEYYATDPQGAIKLSAGQLNLRDVPTVLDTKPAKTANGQPEFDPDQWLPGAVKTTWLEPIGTVKLVETRKIRDIVPWPDGNGVFVLGVRESDSADQLLFAWALSPPSANAPPHLPAIRFPRGEYGEIASPHFNLVRALVLNNDESRLLAVNLTGKCFLWQLTPELQPLEAPLPAGVSVVDFVGNGLVLGMSDGSLRLQPDLSVENFRVLREPTSGNFWTGLTVSPDARRLLTGESDGSVTEWDLTDAKPTGRKWKAAGWPAAIAFHPDGSRFLVATTEGTVRQWDAVSGSVLSTFTLPTGIESAVYSPDGARIAVGNRNGQAIVYDARQPAGVLFSGAIPLLDRASSSDSIKRLSLRTQARFSGDTRFLYAESALGPLEVWDTAAKAGAPAVQILREEGIGPFLIGPRTGRLYRLSLDDGIKIGIYAFDHVKLTRLTDRSDDDPARVLPWFTMATGSATAICPLSGVLAVSATGDETIALGGSATVIHPGSQIVIVRPNDMEAIRASDGDEVGTVQQELDAAALTKDPPAQKKSDNRAPRSREKVRVPPSTDSGPKAAGITTLAFSHDGEFLAVGFDSGEVALLQSRVPPDAPPAYQILWRKSLFVGKPIAHLAVVAGLDRVVAGTREVRGSFDLRSGDSVERTKDAQGSFVSSPDGFSVLARSSEGTRWGVDSWRGNGKTILNDSGSPPTAFAWSPDGAWGVVGLQDGSLSLAHGSHLVETIPAFAREVTAVGFLPDGSGILACDASGTLRAWRLRSAPGPLTPAGTFATSAPEFWQVDIEDMARVSSAPHPAGALAKLESSAKLARALHASWRLEADFARWYRTLPDGPTPAELQTTLALVPDLLSQLRAAGRDVFYLKQTESLVGLLAREIPPDEQALDAIDKLIQVKRWLLLREKTEAWAKQSKEKDAAKRWLAYAHEVDARLRLVWQRESGKEVSEAPDSLARKDLPAAWLPEFDRGVAMTKTAFKGGTPVPKCDSLLFLLFRFPELKVLSAQVKQENELLQKADKALRASDTIAEYRKAAELYEDAVRNKCPIDFGLAVWQAANLRLLRKFKEDERVLEFAESLAASPADRADIDIERAYICLEKAEPGWEQAALEYARKATQDAPDLDYAWSTCASFELYTPEIKPKPAQIEAALHDLDQAIEKSTSDTRIAGYLARKPALYWRLDKPDEARKAADESLKKDASADGYLTVWDGWSYFEEADRLWALDLLEKGIKLATDKSAEKRTLGLLQNERGRQEDTGHVLLREAIRDFLSALEYKEWTPRGHINLLHNLSRALAHEGLFTEEGLIVDAAAKLGPDESDLEAYRGFLLWDRERYGEAAELFRKRLANGTGLDLHSTAANLISVLRDSGKPADAIAAANEFENRFSIHDRTDLLFVKARAYADLAYHSNLQPQTAGKWKEELDASLRELEALLRSAGSPARPNRDLVAISLLRRDEAEARKELARLREKWPHENYEQLLNEAAVNALDAKTDPLKREMALAKLAQAVGLGWCFAYNVTGYPEHRPLQELPEWPGLAEALKIGGIGELRDRELRLADWIKHLNVQSEPAKEITRKAERDCRKRAESDDANPLAKDWKKFTKENHLE